MSFLRHRRKHFRATGGEATYLYNEGEGEDDWVAGASFGTGEQAKNADHLYLYVYSNPGGAALRTYVTDAVVALTASNSIKIEWANTGHANNNNQSILIVDDSKTDNHLSYIARLLVQNTFAKQTSTLALTGLAGGNYYIRVHANDTDIKNDTSSRVLVYKVWIE